MTVVHDFARHIERGASCGAPFSQPHRQALESSFEEHSMTPRDEGYGFEFCKGFGIRSGCI